MTRINVVPVKELCNKHLFAEWREMPRLVKNLESSLNRKSKPFSVDEIPTEYVFGKGHVKFFYNKFKFLHLRYQQLTAELLERGYNLTIMDCGYFKSVPEEFFNDWVPSLEDMKINRQRILEKMPKQPKWVKVDRTIN